VDQVFAAIEEPGPDLQITAVAGSGKTTTLIELLKRLPADRQETALLCAFNKEIADTLAARAPRGAAVRTNPALGYATLADHFRRGGGRWNPKVDGRKYRHLVQAYWCRHFRRSDAPETAAEKAMPELIHFCRVTLTDPRDPDAVARMAAEREVELPDEEPMLEALPTVLQWGIKAAAGASGDPSLPATPTIDFDDMLWLPHAMKLTPPRSLLTLVDECQDLNAAQLDLILKCRAPGGRMLFVGDPHQAIYGFTGADDQAFGKIAERTGAQQLPLSVCYRCPRRVVELARTIVPQIECAPGAPDGVVDEIRERSLPNVVAAGDMVLCRINAPPVKLVFELIGRGIPASLWGRDAGAQLIKTADAIERVDGFTFDRFLVCSARWTEEQIRRLCLKPESELQIASLEDRVASLDVVYGWVVGQGARTMGELRAAIQSLFTDGRGKQVILSSIHRAKGLEAARVYLLRPDLLPHPRATTPAQQRQEENLRYVAYTRAMRELYLVRSG
jgi:superfamily I DNA/RNA helicase